MMRKYPVRFGDKSVGVTLLTQFNGVAGVFGGSLFSAMYGSLVTSSLIRETTESPNSGSIFGQAEESAKRKVS